MSENRMGAISVGQHRRHPRSGEVVEVLDKREDPKLSDHRIREAPVRWRIRRVGADRTSSVLEHELRTWTLVLP